MIELTIDSENRATIDALSDTLRAALPALRMQRSAGIGAGLPPVFRLALAVDDLAAVGAVLAAAELARLRAANAALRQALALVNVEIDAPPPAASFDETREAWREEKIFE
jgi:hypothetical protein